MFDLFDDYPALREPWLDLDDATAVPQNKQDWASPLFTDDDATQVEDVFVVGGRNSSGHGWSGGDYDSSWYDWDGYDTNQDAYGPVPPPRPDGWSDCMDRQIDDLAEIAANAINRLPDAATREYGYLIWRAADGSLHLSNLIEGDNFGLTGLNQNSTPQSLGFSDWSQVVGMLHSHPTMALRPDGTYVEVSPESHYEYPTAGPDGDWSWLDNVFSVNNPFVDMLRNYILYDGNLYEYNLYNNAEGEQSRRELATNANGECGD